MYCQLLCPTSQEVKHEGGTFQNDNCSIIIVEISLNGSIQVVGLCENVIQSSCYLLSQNTTMSLSSEELLDKSLQDLFGEILSQAMTNLICLTHQRYDLTADYGSNFIHSSGGIRNLLPIKKCVDDKTFYYYCSVWKCCNSINKNLYILEIEEEQEKITSSNHLFIENNMMVSISNVLNRIRSADSIELITTVFIDTVMNMVTGYDHGMVYQFNDNNMIENEIMIYENIRDPTIVKASNMNHHFQMCDVSSQMRHLYIRNNIRIIYNVNGIHSKIISHNPLAIVDLAKSMFRSCTTTETQFLLTMGVVAAYSMVIVIDGLPWGFYVFHSYSQPVKPTIEERNILDMIESVATERIKFLTKNQREMRRLKLNRCLRILSVTTTSSSTSSTLSTTGSRHLSDFLNDYWETIVSTLEIDAMALYFQSNNATIKRSIHGDEMIVPSDEEYINLCSLNQNNCLVPSNTYFYEKNIKSTRSLIFYQHDLVCVAFIRRSKVAYDGSTIRREDINLDNSTTYQQLKCSNASVSNVQLTMGDNDTISWCPFDCELCQSLIDQIIQNLQTELLTQLKSSLEISKSECLRLKQSSKQDFEYFAHMSHELRTPFHGVISSLQILNSEKLIIDVLDQKEIIVSALECGAIMLRTLDDIISIAKNHNHTKVAKLPFLIARVFYSTKHMMIHMAQLKHIHLLSEIGPFKVSNKVLHNSDFKSLILLGDETRLGQICNNLINNAIKFTPTGGTVMIRTVIVSSYIDVLNYWNEKYRRFDHSLLLNQDAFLSNIHSSFNHDDNDNDDDDVFVIYEVEDTGCGIGGNDISTIIDAYKQVSSSSSSSSSGGTYQGTGLGLHIVRLHIESMNGILGVASTIHKGTLFLFAVSFKVSSSPSPLNSDNLITR